MDQTAPFKYVAPTDQILAAIKDVAGYDTIAAYPEFAHADLETVEELIREAGNLTESVIAPVNRGGDQVGAKYDPATMSVTTPPGFADAYRAYVDGGWPTLGLMGLGFEPGEADGLLDGAEGNTPEDLIAAALKAAR